MRLIDADKFKAYMQEEYICYDHTLADIDKQPTVDAELVVRCKDCKHKPSGSGANHDVEFPDTICPCQCEDSWYSWVPKDNFFCAWGERKEDEQLER